MQDGQILCCKMWIVCVGKQYFISYLNLPGFGNFAKLNKSFVAVMFDDTSIKFVVFQLFCGMEVRKSGWMPCYLSRAYILLLQNPATLLSLNIIVIKLGQEEKEQERNTKGNCDLKFFLEKMSKVLFGLPEDEIRRMSGFSMLGMI